MNKIFFFFIFLLLACKGENSIDNAKPMNSGYVNDYNNKIKMNELHNRVILTGDTIAFRNLKHIYTISEHSEEFLYVSTVMSEKYNYGPAFQTNYQILKLNKNIALKRLAIYNLLKSYELGNKNNTKELNELFLKGIPKSTDYLNNIDNLSD